MRTISSLALVFALCGLAGPNLAQDPAKGGSKAQTTFASFRELMGEGKFDVAANFLQAFVDLNPSDEDILEVEKRYGTTVFQLLRNVRWSEEPVANEKAQKNVKILIDKSHAANAKLLYTPARVGKFIRNLGATYEERVFAELELKRTGDYAIPFMVEELQNTREKALQAGLIESIGVLEGSTMSGWVAALDGLNPDLQYSVVATIAARTDVIKLETYAQSDLSPYLWHQLTKPAGENIALKELATSLLNRLHPGARTDTKSPEVELTALARKFYDHEANFSGLKSNPEGTPSTVKLWIFDPKTSKLVKLDVPKGQAEEYYGLRYARWALEFKPNYEPAQGLLISLAAEQGMERARFGSLAKAEPAVYKLLSEAPSRILAAQLERGLNHKKTSLVLALLQVLGDRGDREVATPPAGAADHPSLFVKALGYPDPQVQLAAANALLRSPVPVPSSARPLIVDILRRALANPGAAEGTTGTALLADPNKNRSDSTSAILRGLGYEVEVVSNGRDLLRRIARSSDFDIIFIDHHIPNPELIDLVGQIQADVKTANRPTLVIASPDKSKLPTYDQLIVRFAALIASTENEKIGLEAPFVPNPLDREKPDEDVPVRRANAQLRDKVLIRAAEERLARLHRLIESTNLELTDTQKLILNLRLDLLTYKILQMQYPFSMETAPETMGHILRFRKQLDAQAFTPPYGDARSVGALIKLMERFDADLARVPARKKEFETLYAKIDPAEFGFAVETFREPEIEARLGRVLRNYPTVRIIPEPFARMELAGEIKASYVDPAQAPRDPNEKKMAQKTAIEWFRKMAIGDLPGYELKSAEEEIRSALRVDDLAESAIDAVARFGSSAAQESLLLFALNGTKPLPLRIKAADATIHHIQVNGKSIPKTLLASLVELSNTEPDLALRAKLLTLKGLLATTPDDFANQLKGYNPPIIPPAPAKEPAKEPGEGVKN